MQQEDANDDACTAADKAFSSMTRAQSKAIPSASTDPLPDLPSLPTTDIDLPAKPISMPRHVPQNIQVFTWTPFWKTNLNMNWQRSFFGIIYQSCSLRITNQVTCLIPRGRWWLLESKFKNSHRPNQQCGWDSHHQHLIWDIKFSCTPNPSNPNGEPPLGRILAYCQTLHKTIPKLKHFAI